MPRPPFDSILKHSSTLRCCPAAQSPSVSQEWRFTRIGTVPMPVGLHLVADEDRAGTREEVAGAERGAGC
jgi:hypothetical protein